MSRQRTQAYRSRELAELSRQLLYAPPAKRAEVVRHAERLHDELEPASNYPLDFLVYRLTDRRIPPSESVTLVGEAVLPDLRLLIDALSRSIQMSADEGDPCETTAQLAERLGVSTKTVARWRDSGLRWRWAAAPGQRPGVVIPCSAVDAFERRQRGRVAQAASFNRMSAREKRRLIDRARRLADAAEVTPHAVLTHLSRRTGRAVETLRLLMEQHDREHPDSPVFAGRSGPLTPRQRAVIDRAYRRGVRVSAICRRFRKTRSTVYRVIHEARAARALAVELRMIASPMFDRDDAQEVILRPVQRAGRKRTLDRATFADLPGPVAAAYDRPIDSDRVIRAMIVRYNFLKHLTAKAQETLRVAEPRAADLDRFDALMRRVADERGELLAGTLPIVLSVVRRQLIGRSGIPADRVLGMLDAGNAVLIEEIDLFDTARSHQFESVLTNRLLRVLAQPNTAAGCDPDKLVGRLALAGLKL